MSPVMFDDIMKELTSLISENDLHVSQVGLIRLTVVRLVFLTATNNNIL